VLRKLGLQLGMTLLSPRGNNGCARCQMSGVRCQGFWDLDSTKNYVVFDAAFLVERFL